MEVQTVDDIVRLIKYRDNLSIREARTIVDDCIDELKHCNYTIDNPEDIIADYLGLEPDYLDILIQEII